MLAMSQGVFDSSGLDAFRRPDGNGQACANCHSPDGIELRSFSDATLRRRIGRHFTVGGTDATAVFEYLRQQPRQVGAVRPFQPAGSPIWYATANARDRAFGQILARRAPRLSGALIASTADAEAVAEEVKQIDLFALPIGIPLNRLSNDVFHGAKQGTVADWIPDTPAAPDFALQDAYLASPNRARLAEMVSGTQFGLGAAEKLSGLKYQALAIYQHWLRTGERVTPVGDSPFWQIGEFGRLERGHPLNELGFPPRVRAESRATNMADLRLPWYWLGWMFDPGLQRSGDLPETRRADYFVRSLREDGPYPNHTLFMLTRKLAEQGTNPSAWNSDFVQMYEIQYSFWLLDQAMPKLDSVGKRIEANSFLMSLYLLARDIRRTGAVLLPESQRTQVKLIQAELRRIGQPNDELCETTLALIKSARPIR